MADVAISDGSLRIELTVPERVLSLHDGSVVVPLEQISGVRVVRDVLAHLRGTRRPGAGLPGLMAMGTWRGVHDGRAFHGFGGGAGAGPGVVITTTADYERILLATDEPEKLAFQLGR